MLPAMYSVLQFWWLDIWKSLILKGHWHFYKFCPRSNTISLSSRCTSIKFIYKDEVNCHIATFVIRLTIRILFSWPIAMQCNASFYQMFFYHKKKKCTFILCFKNQSQRRIWLANNVIIQWNTVLTSSFFS